MRIVVSTLVGLALAWLAMITALVVWRPRGMDLAEAKRFVPDVVRLLRAVSKDPACSRTIRLRLGLLLVYLALPIDLIPDFVPVLGYADDVVVVSLALRSIVRRAGRDVVARNWAGTDVGLAIVWRLAGVRDGS